MSTDSKSRGAKENSGGSGGSGVGTSPWTLVIHGGAGTIDPGNPAREKRFLRQIELALQKGRAILAVGGTALDAVEASVRHLEDSPLYNAGRGAVFTSDYTHELDASIMEGQHKKAGAVCAVKHTKNPISAARVVMNKSMHVMLCGAGADQFAKEHGLELVPNSYFDTKRRRKQIDAIVAKQKAWKAAAATTAASSGRSPEQKLVVLDHSGASLVQRTEAAAALKPVVSGSAQTEPTTTGAGGGDRTKANSNMIGTVGAVALDIHGTVASATSTGGMTNKSFGRVGDSPIIGAGTYADNATCAVSCTGYGEFFMRACVAHSVHAAMYYGHQTLAQASATVLAQFGTYGPDFTGGFIGVESKTGAWTAPHNSTGMYKGVITSAGQHQVSIWNEQWISGDAAINEMIASIPPPKSKPTPSTAAGSAGLAVSPVATTGSSPVKL